MNLKVETIFLNFSKIWVAYISVHHAGKALQSQHCLHGRFITIRLVSFILALEYFGGKKQEKNCNCNPFFCLSAMAQKNIIYSFERPVNDSLIEAIKWYEKAYKKGLNDLKLVAVIVEGLGITQINLVEYSPVKLIGFQYLVKRTNRRLKLSDHIILPIIFPSDEHSVQFKSDHIENLPYSGYSILIRYERHKLKSIQTYHLF
jgi:hypothetical protein